MNNENNGWQPIETAPKNKRIIIGIAGCQESVCFAKDRGVRKRVWYNGSTHIKFEPTHWMYIAIPPKP